MITKIKLKKTMVQTLDGKYPGYKPSSLDDTTLFVHCSNGYYSITEQYFDENVEPLLRIHGIIDIEIEE